MIAFLLAFFGVAAPVDSSSDKWVPLELKGLTVPISTFICNNSDDDGWAFIFIRHDNEKSVVSIDGIHNNEEMEIKGDFDSASVKTLDSGRKDFKIVAHDAHNYVSIIIHGGGHPVTADLTMNSGKSVHSASCLAVAPPIGRTE